MTSDTVRDTELKEMLVARQHELRHDVEMKLREERADRRSGGDDLEHSDADSQSEIELTLLRMKVETLTRIDAALVRLDAGQYGTCAQCGADISKRRLRALPFAVSCQSCEEEREVARDSARRLTQRHDSLPMFAMTRP